VKKLIPTEKPTPEERKAIGEKDEVADENELMKAWANLNIENL